MFIKNIDVDKCYRLNGSIRVEGSVKGKEVKQPLKRFKTDKVTYSEFVSALAGVYLKKVDNLVKVKKPKIKKLKCTDNVNVEKLEKKIEMLHDFKCIQQKNEEGFYYVIRLVLLYIN